MNIKRARNVENLLMAEGFFISFNDIMAEDLFDDYIDEIAALIRFDVDRQCMIENCIDGVTSENLKEYIQKASSLKQSLLRGIDLNGTELELFRSVKSFGSISQDDYNRIGDIKKVQRYGKDFIALLREVALAGFDLRPYTEVLNKLKPDLNRTNINVDLFLNNKNYLFFADAESFVNTLVKVQNENVNNSDEIDYPSEKDFIYSKFNTFIINLCGYEVDRPLHTIEQINDFFYENEGLSIEAEVKRIKLLYGLKLIEDMQEEAEEDNDKSISFDYDMPGVSYALLAVIAASGIDHSVLEPFFDMELNPLEYLQLINLYIEGLEDFIEPYLNDIEMSREIETYKDIFAVNYFAKKQGVDFDEIIKDIDPTYANQNDAFFYLTLGANKGIDIEKCKTLVKDNHDYSIMKPIVEHFLVGESIGISPADLSDAISKFKTLGTIQNWILFKKLGLEAYFDETEELSDDELSDKLEELLVEKSVYEL